MTALTPEAARAAAEWLESRSPSMAFDLRAEADRLEAAAKTPGQVAREVFDGHPSTSDHPFDDCWEASAAAVIAHHVGPNRVVVDWNDLDAAINNARPKPSVIDRLREALS